MQLVDFDESLQHVGSREVFLRHSEDERWFWRKLSPPTGALVIGSLFGEKKDKLNLLYTEVIYLMLLFR